MTWASSGGKAVCGDGARIPRIAGRQMEATRTMSGATRQAWTSTRSLGWTAAFPDNSGHFSINRIRFPG